MSDEAFYSPNLKSPSPRQSGELLFEFVRPSDRAPMSCERRFHSGIGRVASILLAVALHVLLCANSASSQDIAELSVQQLRKLAEAGDVAAEFQLGYRYAFGEGGLMRDYGEAAKWYRRAADAGNASAQLGLGVLYVLGQGVQKDPQRAAFWFQKAAGQGNHGAESNLAKMYLRGDGVPRDERRAFEWFLKAAEGGFATSAYQVGVFYDDGRIVPQDYAQALKWYQQAAEGLDFHSFPKLAALYENGHGVAQDIVEAYKWYSLSVPISFTRPDDGQQFAAKCEVLAQTMTAEQLREARTRADDWMEAHRHQRPKPW